MSFSTQITFFVDSAKMVNRKEQKRKILYT